MRLKKYKGTIGSKVNIGDTVFVEYALDNPNNKRLIKNENGNVKIKSPSSSPLARNQCH